MNRSEAIRDLIRDALVKREWSRDETVTAGIAVLVYDHHQRELSRKITDAQHNNHRLIISSIHVHMDDDNCLEVVLMRGKAKDMRHLANNLISTRGVKHGQFVGTTTGKNI